jgi:hypothetical protein
MPPTSSKLHRWIQARKRAGRSSEQIADELAARGIRPPGTPSQVAAPVDSQQQDAVRAHINTLLQTYLQQAAERKLRAAGVGADGTVRGKAAKVAAEFLPNASASFWAGLQIGIQKYVAETPELKRKAELPGARITATFSDGQYVEKFATAFALEVHGGQQVVLKTTGGHIITTVALADPVANSSAPLLNAPPVINIQNDIYVPAQPAPVVNVQTPAPLQPSRTEIEYEVGPDGKQRPRAVTRR